MAASEMALEELKARFEGDLTTRYSDEYLQIKLDEAIALIKSECPSVPSRLLSGALDVVNFKRIVADVVFRVIRNPGGFESEGEGGVSYKLRSTVASGDLWLTDKDVATLTGVRPNDSKTLPGTVSIGLDTGWGQ